jgi:energy-coupling factor transporter ATP-binding protein EcfA2
MCYQTLNHKGPLSTLELDAIYELFSSQGDAVSPSPQLAESSPLRLCAMTHQSGVNALNEGETITFCEEGMTLLYGKNGSGKTGYYRILEHLAGVKNAAPILHDIHADAQHQPVYACDIVYKVGQGPQLHYSWKNEEADNGNKIFNGIKLFKSTSVKDYLSSHTLDTYTLQSQDTFYLKDFMQNVEALRERIAKDCPEYMERFNRVNFEALSFDQIVHSYLEALGTCFQEKVKELIGKDMDVRVDSSIEGTDKISVKVCLKHPYAIDEVLSEGEMKALALAMFFAELEMCKVKEPVVFDDPVNSLDNSIIGNFVMMLQSLQNPVIVFTHNIWFFKQIQDKYKNPKSKSHLIAYNISAEGRKKGIIIPWKSENASHYLDAIDGIIQKEVLSEIDKETIANNLRRAIEHLVDEVIFCGLTPCCFRTRESIQWTKLESLSDVNKEVVRAMSQMYKRLSGASLHVGMESMENGLDSDELRTFYNGLRDIMNNKA